MALDDADRIKLEEIERQFARDHPDVTGSFGGRGSEWRRTAVATIAAAVVFLVALGSLSLMTGSAIPVLLALPPVLVTTIPLGGLLLRRRAPR